MALAPELLTMLNFLRTHMSVRPNVTADCRVRIGLGHN